LALRRLFKDEHRIRYDEQEFVSQSLSPPIVPIVRLAQIHLRRRT
jgi:hypothetical protein